jgi:hypothetical protein
MTKGMTNLTLQGREEVSTTEEFTFSRTGKTSQKLFQN